MIKWFHNFFAARKDYSKFEDTHDWLYEVREDFDKISNKLSFDLGYKIRDEFKEFKKNRIINNPSVLGGELVFAKSGLSINHINGLVKRGESIDNILQDYTYLTLKDVLMAYMYENNVISTVILNPWFISRFVKDDIPIILEELLFYIAGLSFVNYDSNNPYYEESVILDKSAIINIVAEQKICKSFAYFIIDELKGIETPVGKITGATDGTVIVKVNKYNINRAKAILRKEKEQKGLRK